ncbi:MAG: hypothetical protein QNL61_04690 [Crocinitomicaceae bacterium]
MKFKMLSLLSIILVLTVKSMEISAKDYNEFRVLIHAIPSNPSNKILLAYRYENKLDSIVFHINQTSTVTAVFEPKTDETIDNTFIFNELLQNANENELNALLTHQSASVKVYAFRALLINDMNVNNDFELALLTDTSCVNLISKSQIIPSTVQEIVKNDLRVYK